jgi:hypothetical protein
MALQLKWMMLPVSLWQVSIKKANRKKKKTCTCRIGEPTNRGRRTKKRRYLQHDREIKTAAIYNIT